MTDFAALQSSYEHAAAATALSRGMSPERIASRAAAYADTERRNQELRTLQATRPTDQDLRTMAETQTAELQGALQKQQEIIRDGNVRRSHAAFERYDVDGDVRHINTMLSDIAKTGSKLYGNVTRVDRITENDRKMLEDLGLTPNLIDAIIKNPTLNKSYFKVTDKQGQVILGDVDMIKGLTKYNDYATTQEIERQKNARMLEQLAILGYPADDLGAEALRRTRAELGYDADPRSTQFQQRFSEIYDKLVKDKKAGRGSAASASVGGMGNPTEAEAEAIRRAAVQDGLEEGDPGWSEAVSRHMSAIKTEWSRPSATRNIEVAEQARAKLEENGFWETDFNNLTPRQRSQFEPDIRRIEQLSGAELSPTDRATLEKIQRLTSLGANASQLTDEQTGIIDSILTRTKRYIFNEVEGIDATSAYNAYRNLVQHALYGAALTPNEAENFTKQFGSLAQQTGPVLQQLRTTMQEIVDAYQAIARTNDPMVMMYRAGKTETELLDVINSLDERIQYIDNMAKGINVPAAVTTPKPGNVIPELTDEKRARLRMLKGSDQ